MAHKRYLKLLEYSVIVIPILVALSQFVLYKTSDLTLWKGGGFGMYSTPHPVTSRHAWLIGETDGEPTFYRMHHLDERLNLNQLKDESLQTCLQDFVADAKYMRYFPSFAKKRKMKERYKRLLSLIDTDSEEQKILPREYTKLVVTELRLTPDFKRIEMESVYEHALTHD